MIEMIEVAGQQYKVVDISEIPDRIIRYDWDRIFGTVPEGKALHVTEKVVNESTIRIALKRKQSKGKFIDLEYVTRTIGELKHIYVVRRNKKVM